MVSTECGGQFSVKVLALLGSATASPAGATGVPCVGGRGGQTATAPACALPRFPEGGRAVIGRWVFSIEGRSSEPGAAPSLRSSDAYRGESGLL
jgi:hypothetical protein